MRRAGWSAACAVAAIVAGAAPAGADGSEALGPPSAAIAAADGLAVGAAGLFQQPAELHIDVPAGAAVRQVLLYWEGFHTPAGGAADDTAEDAADHAADDAADDTVTVNGHTVKGARIGGPTTFWGASASTTHRADVTGLDLVKAGRSTLRIGGFDADLADGAGVVALYDLPTRSGAVHLRDGNDLAYAKFAAPLDATAAQTFRFPTSSAARTASLHLLVGGVRDTRRDPAERRPSSLEVTVGGVTHRLVGVFDNHDGAEFDALTLPIELPAGADAVTVRVVSFDDGSGASPASLTWVFAGLAVPDPAPAARPIQPLAIQAAPQAPPAAPVEEVLDVVQTPLAAPTAAAPAPAPRLLAATGRMSTTLAVTGLALVTGGAVVLVGRRRRPAGPTLPR